MCLRISLLLFQKPHRALLATFSTLFVKLSSWTPGVLLMDWLSDPNMRSILILAASLLCIFSAKADDDYATIVRYLGENGHYIISPDDVAKVRAFMKANGYQHVKDIPKGSFAAGGPVAQQTATPTEPSSGPKITHIVVPSAPAEDYPPISVHVGNTTADAIAYSKKLIPYLTTHTLQGHKDFALFEIILRAAQEAGHVEDYDWRLYCQIVDQELKAAGESDSSGKLTTQ